MDTKANILEVHARTGNSGGLKNGNLTKNTVEFGDEMVHVITVARGIIGVSGPAARRLNLRKRTHRIMGFGVSSRPLRACSIARLPGSYRTGIRPAGPRLNQKTQTRIKQYHE
jgi:hypothetical protein